MTDGAEPPASTLSSLGRPATVASAAAVGLAASAVVARRAPVPQWELDLTETINDVPDPVATALYPVMQLGTLGGPIAVAAGIALVRRDRRLAGATVAAGLIAWFGAKGVKRIIDRGRPQVFLPEIHVREGTGDGLGFISGHSAVAASAAVMAMVMLPSRWRFAAAGAAGLVGIARIVHGVHLPADVIGGWSFGVLVSLGVLGVLDRLEAGGASLVRQ